MSISRWMDTEDIIHVRIWRPTPGFIPRKPHGERSVVGYSSRGRKESDMPLATEHAYICTREYHSITKKNEIMPFAATWMQLKIIILSEVSQRKTNIMCYHLYLESKIWHKRTYLWNRNRHTGIENKLMVAKRKWGQEGTDWEFGVNRCKLLYVEWINNKVLL